MKQEGFFETDESFRPQQAYQTWFTAGDVKHSAVGLAGQASWIRTRLDPIPMKNSLVVRRNARPYEPEYPGTRSLRDTMDYYIDYNTGEFEFEVVYGDSLTWEYEDGK